VLVQTQTMQEMAVAAGAPLGKVHLIPPGVDTAFFTPLEALEAQERGERPCTLLSASDVNWQTDIETALLAIRNLCDAGVPVRFWLGGVDGYLEKEWVLYTINDLDLQEVVEVNGRWPLVRRRQLMQQADIYLDLNATLQVTPEVLEALACGLPVAVHAYNGAQQWLGASAIQFGHHDIAGLTDQLCRLVRQPAAERAALAEQARQAAFPLDWSQVNRPFKELYDRCLDR
jgi:glycosyltransferase involved in cell wall biosynthesis